VRGQLRILAALERQACHAGDGMNTDRVRTRIEEFLAELDDSGCPPVMGEEIAAILARLVENLDAAEPGGAGAAFEAAEGLALLRLAHARSARKWLGMVRRELRRLAEIAKWGVPTGAPNCARQEAGAE
jgi:hypothetical protein